MFAIAIATAVMIVTMARALASEFWVSPARWPQAPRIDTIPVIQATISRATTSKAAAHTAVMPAVRPTTATTTIIERDRRLPHEALEIPSHDGPGFGGSRAKPHVLSCARSACRLQTVPDS